MPSHPAGTRTLHGINFLQRKCQFLSSLHNHRYEPGCRIYFFPCSNHHHRPTYSGPPPLSTIAFQLDNGQSGVFILSMLFSIKKCRELVSARRIFYLFGVGSGLAVAPQLRDLVTRHQSPMRPLSLIFTCNMIAYIPIFTQFFEALLGHFPGLHFPCSSCELPRGCLGSAS